jgi:hypothetical protein
VLNGTGEGTKIMVRVEWYRREHQGMERVEWYRKEHQGSEQCDEFDVKTDMLISSLHFIHLSPLHMGRTVAQLVEALRYKPVRFPMVSLEFFYLILPALWPWVRLSLIRKYQEYILGTKSGRCHLPVLIS